MDFRKKIYVNIFAVLPFIVVLLFLGLSANAAQAIDNPPEPEVITGPETGPEQHKMSLVSFEPWVSEGQMLGILASYVYDDVTTERAADYWELYDREGNLLAVGWFDKFGIERAAVDRGIVEEKDQLEGVFVMVVDGQTI